MKGVGHVETQPFVMAGWGAIDCSVKTNKLGDQVRALKKHWYVYGRTVEPYKHTYMELTSVGLA